MAPMEWGGNSGANAHWNLETSHPIIGGSTDPILDSRSQERGCAPKQNPEQSYTRKIESTATSAAVLEKQPQHLSANAATLNITTLERSLKIHCR